MSNWSIRLSRFCALLLAVSVLVGGELSGRSAPSETVSEGIPFDASNGYTDVCRLAGHVLQYSDITRAVRLVSDVTGAVEWDSVVTESLYDTSTSSQTWKNLLGSVLSVRYASASDTRGNSSVICTKDTSVAVQALLLKNGLRLEIDFSAAQISLAVEITLVETGLEVRLPAEDIQEYGENYLLSVDVFPYFGAAAADADGYIFYPDGSGALSYFSKTDEKPLYTESLSLDIYGPMDDEQLLNTADTPDVMLPVYGIKNGDHAFLAAITQGDYNAQILVNTAVNTSAVPLNSAVFRFVYHNEYRLYLSNITSSDAQTGDQAKYGVKREKELLREDRTVRFFLLEGESADYSGMANVYRAYLLETGALVKSKISGAETLALTVFMGAQKQGALLKSFVETCDFEAATEIIQDYLDEGISNLSIRLRGWSSNGYGFFPQSLNPARQLGGKKGLKMLDKLAGANESLHLALELNVTDATVGQGSFSKRRDVVIKGNSIPVSDADENDFLLSPQKSQKIYNRAVKKFTYLANIDFSMQSVGQRIYRNAYQKGRLNRGDTAELFREIAAGNSVDGGNLYLLSDAQQLYEIPFESSMHVLTDESIPFYQMVVHGLIPYYSSAGNLFYSLEDLKLKWIEYGYVPHFEITAKSTSELKATGYNQLFTARNDKWMPKILEIYRELAENLAAVGDAYIVAHRQITDRVFVTAYSNGYKIYINASDSAVQIGEIQIAPKDYIVLEEDV